MKISKHGIVFLLMLTVTLAKAQMNFQDSSVQIIAYWNLGEKYEYSLRLQKLKYTENDTTSNEMNIGVFIKTNNQLKTTKDCSKKCSYLQGMA